MKKTILTALIVLAVLTGIFFFVRYHIKLHKTVIYLIQKEAILENFIMANFPDQVKAFNETLPK